MPFEPHWEEKDWGRVLHVFCSEQAAVSHLEVRCGFRCSMHRHRKRANQFVVVSGSLLVEVPSLAEVKALASLMDARSSEKALFDVIAYQPATTDLVLILPGQSFTVKSRIYHRFRCPEDAVVIEIYWPDRRRCVVRFDDIERLDEGGVDPDHAGDLLARARRL